MVVGPVVVVVGPVVVVVVGPVVVVVVGPVVVVVVVVDAGRKRAMVAASGALPETEGVQVLEASSPGATPAMEATATCELPELSTDPPRKRPQVRELRASMRCFPRREDQGTPAVSVVPRAKLSGLRGRSIDRVWKC